MHVGTASSPIRASYRDRFFSLCRRHRCADVLFLVVRRVGLLSRFDRVLAPLGHVLGRISFLGDREAVAHPGQRRDAVLVHGPVVVAVDDQIPFPESAENGCQSFLGDAGLVG